MCRDLSERTAILEPFVWNCFIVFERNLQNICIYLIKNKSNNIAKCAEFILFEYILKCNLFLDFQQLQSWVSHDPSEIIYSRLSFF